jgi:phosphomevalonate kinase
VNGRHVLRVNVNILPSGNYQLEFMFILMLPNEIKKDVEMTTERRGKYKKFPFCRSRHKIYLYCLTLRNPAMNKATATFILISGKRYAGKDAFAGLLKEELEKLGKSAEIQSTARMIKEEFCRLHGFDIERFETDRAYKERHRDLLTEFVSTRSAEQNMEAFLKRVASSPEGRDFIIVPDLRTAHDLYALRPHSAAIIRVATTDKAREARGWKRSSYDDSPSETELDREEFDFVVPNNEGFEQLRAFAQAIVRQL